MRKGDLRFMKIVLTGGGTAGHVMPNLALIPCLENRFDGIYYIGSVEGMEKTLCEERGVKFFATDTVKLRRDRFFSNLSIPFKMKNCVKQAKNLLEEIRPDVVFSKGGYVALPVCLAARSLKIPVVAHESDTTLGLANKITQRFARCVITSHKATEAKNSVFIGNPLRPELFKADGSRVAEKYGLKGKKPLLLVVGGSGGSQALNDIILSNLEALTEKYEIIHITGKNASETKAKDYACKQYAKDIFDLYAAADVIISRAGANAVREITAMGKRALYIPLPKTASRGDQILNAKQAAASGKAAMLEQENVSRTKLLSALNYLMSSPPPKPEIDATVNERIAEVLYNTAKTYSPYNANTIK